MNRYFRALAAVAVSALLVVAAAKAQTGVTVQLYQPPPNQLKVADLWRIRLVNTSQTTYTVCLFGTLEETGLGKLLVDATTARFQLPPGTKIVSGAEIQPIDANYYDDKYKQIFLRTGQAPAGEYRICVEVRLDCGPQVMARDCKDQRVHPTTPPILIAPANESQVSDKLPTFSWLPPAPASPGQGVRYQLKIVEVLGRQTPYDAMQSNPAWFVRDQIAPTVLQYPLSARAFSTGEAYAWQIKAFTADIPMGESEIWWFTVTKPTNTGDNDRTPRTFIDSGGVRLLGGKTPGGFTPGFTPVDHGTIQYNPTGDVRMVFGDPTKQLLQNAGVGYDAAKLTSKEVVDIIKELMRSCNE